MRHYYLIVDTETTKKQTVADFGAVVVTKQGKIVEQFGAMVLNHFGKLRLFSDAEKKITMLCSKMVSGLYARLRISITGLRVSMRDILPR